jgi:flagellar basal body-associated protein FliL
MFKSASKSRLMQLYIFVLLVFAGLASCGYFFAEEAGLIKRPAPMTHKFVSEMAYIDLPRMIVDMGHKGSLSQVQVDISLEIADKDKYVVEGYKPLITDKINNFLANEKPEEIERISKMPWLRHEILRQINSAGAPVPVYDVFFREMFIM